MCFVDLEKAFDRDPRKFVQWVMKKKKGVPEMVVKAVMGLYEEPGAKTIVGTSNSEEFSVTV